MTALKDTFTSTGAKWFAHTDAMQSLRAGKGRVISTHLMITDVCQHSCSFCSVHHREGKTLPFDDILGYVDILLKHGLKACTVSGGGNPLLYKCKATGKNLNDVVDALHERGLEIGLITNGMPLANYITNWSNNIGDIRRSWKGIPPRTLDKITWIRVSMSGLDHDENEVYVPEVDRSKTTLGFSYCLADIYEEPADPYHGKVSAEADLITLNRVGLKTRYATDRLPELTQQIGDYVRHYKPVYCRTLPNCLEPWKLPERCEQLQKLCDEINATVDYGDPCFVQYKPPRAPNVCYHGYVKPCLNSDGFVVPCDSCCLNEGADHKLGGAWAISHWSKIGEIYEQPVRSLVDPKKLCPGCVFSTSCDILEGVVNGTIDPVPPEIVPLHVNFP